MAESSTSSSPQLIGREFVRQYYTMMGDAPQHVYRFYNTESVYAFNGSEYIIDQQAINERIESLNLKDCQVTSRVVDAHQTLNKGVVVQVIGEIAVIGGPLRRFAQTFVLALKSEKKYYVHNDTFRYLDDLFDENVMLTDAETAIQNDVEQPISNNGRATLNGTAHPEEMVHVQKVSQTNLYTGQKPLSQSSASSNASSSSGGSSQSSSSGSSSSSSSSGSSASGTASPKHAVSGKTSSAKKPESKDRTTSRDVARKPTSKDAPPAKKDEKSTSDRRPKSGASKDAAAATPAVPAAAPPAAVPAAHKRSSPVPSHDRENRPKEREHQQRDKDRPDKERERQPPQHRRSRSRSVSPLRERKRSPTPKPTRLHIGRLTRNVTKSGVANSTSAIRQEKPPEPSTKLRIKCSEPYRSPESKDSSAVKEEPEEVQREEGPSTWADRVATANQGTSFVNTKSNVSPSQTKFKDLQLNHSKLTLELERLEAEKQSQEQKAEESLKTAKNRVAEIEDKYSNLAKEVEKLRKENSQLKQTLSDQQNRLPDNFQQSVNNSVKVVERNVPDAFTKLAEGSLKISVFKWDDRLNRSSVADKIVITAEQIPPFHQVPGNNRENISRTELSNGSQSDSFASVNNSQLVPQTRAPLPEVKQIHKPFTDSHQQQLLENAKFPPMPRENLLGKPVKFDSKLPDTENLKNVGDSDYAGENIGHLPVNVRDENVDDDFNAQMPDDGKRRARQQQHIANVLPLPSNANDKAFNKNIRDVNKTVEDNRLFGNKNAIEAGARVVKEPKEYHAGALGTRGRRRNAVADIIENSTTIGELGKSDKGETSSSSLKIEKEPLHANIASSVSHKKPHKRSFLKRNVIIPRVETNSLECSSSSIAKKSKIVEKASVCENVVNCSEKKIVNVDKSSSVVASLSANRNSAKNKKFNAPKIQKVGNETVGIDNVSSGEKKSAVCKNLNGDEITSDNQCRLCDVVVTNGCDSKRHHVEKVHLNDIGVDWLYQCIACGHRSICFRQMSRHLCRPCPKGIVAYFMNNAFAKRIADVCHLAFPSAPFRFFLTNDAHRVKCAICNKIVGYGCRNRHALQHIKETTDVSWIYKCLLCDESKSLYRGNVRSHVKKIHKVQSFRIGAEYMKIDSVGDIINTVAICFPGV